MKLNYADSLLGLQRETIELCMELTNGKVSKIYVYSFIEKKERFFHAFFEKNDQIVAINQVGADGRLAMRFLEIGTQDLEKIVALCKKCRHEIPREMKLIYDVRKSSLDAQYQYPEKKKQKGDQTSAEERFYQWQEDVKREMEDSRNPKASSVGWDAITAECERVYPDQTDPKHYGTLVKWRFGGEDPLDGISVYDGGAYWHFVTYGLTELYDKETDDAEYSGYGMEFTCKLKKDAYENTENEICCICGILQAIAKITFDRGELFESYQYLYTGQIQGIDSKKASNITGFITVPDDKFRDLDTPNGKVSFVEFIGATDAELKALKDKKFSVKELYEKLESDMTDYHRASVV